MMFYKMEAVFIALNLKDVGNCTSFVSQELWLGLSEVELLYKNGNEYDLNLWVVCGKRSIAEKVSID
jgi:hypothetical protein